MKYRGGKRQDKFKKEKEKTICKLLDNMKQPTISIYVIGVTRRKNRKKNLRK